MRKWLAAAVCATLAIAAPKEAIAFEDGNELLEFATSKDSSGRLAYLTYVSGVVQAFSLALAVYKLPPAYCVVGTPNEDIGDTVRIWLRRNPELLNAAPAVIVVAALNEHFPCEAEDQ